MKITAKIKGATLIETLIYSALMALTIGAVVYAVTTIVITSDELNEFISAEEEANFIIKKMEWALTGYEAINSPASGSSAESISINKYGYASNPIVFDLNSGSIRIKKGAGDPVILNSSRVTINSLSFTHIAAVGAGPDGVRVEMDLAGRDYKLVIYKK